MMDGWSPLPVSGGDSREAQDGLAVVEIAEPGKRGQPRRWDWISRKLGDWHVDGVPVGADPSDGDAPESVGFH